MPLQPEPPRFDRRDAAALAALAVFGILWLSQFFAIFDAQRRDEGLLTEPAFRMLAGEVPYRDYRTHAPPLPILAVAPFYAVLGVKVVSHKIPMVLQFLGIAGMMYGIGRGLAGRRAAFAAAFTFLGFQAMAWPIVSHHWLSVLSLLVLYAVLLARGASAAAGVLTGLAFLCSANAGLAALVTSAALLVLRRSAPWPYLAGLAAVGAVASLAFASVGAFGAWLDDTFLGAARHVRIHRQVMDPSAMAVPFATLAQASPGRLFTHFYLWMSQLYSMTALPAAFLLCCAAGLGGVAFRAVQRTLSLRTGLLALMTVVYAAPLLGYHLIPTYMGFVTPFLYLLVLDLFGLGRGVLAFVVVANLFWPYLGVYLHRQFVHPIPFAAGTLYSQSAEEAAVWMQVQQHVDRTVPPGGPILYVPMFQLGGLDVLLQRRNVAPFYNVVPFLGSPDVDVAALLKAAQDREQPRLLLLPKVNPEAESDRAFAADLLAVYGALMPGYRPVMQTEALLLLVRP